VTSDKGIFIVLEGVDGSGKSTQFKLLAERLKAVGYDIEIFKFPQYNQDSSHFIKKYLNGEYGKAESISPYTASLFYALDRYEAAPKIKAALQQGKIVLADRYVGSNMAHQGSKFTNSGEQRGFFIWEDGLEFQMLGIPRPDLNIFLRVSAEISQELISKKAKRSYTDETHDQHEASLGHLKQSIATYDTLCKLFPKDFKEIDCAPGGKLLSVPEINDKVWKMIKPILPETPPHKGREVVFKLDEPEEAKVPKPEIVEPTTTQQRSKESGPNTDGKLEITIKKVSLLAANRVQNIAGVKSEIIFEQWPADGNYNFYTPVGLDKKLLEKYRQTFTELAGLHKRLKAAQKGEAALRNLTPLAALTTLKIAGSEENIIKLISALRRSPLAEIKWLAEQIRISANQLSPDKFKDAPGKDILAQLADPLSKIASKNLTADNPNDMETITLQNTWPRNEFALLADALFPYSNSSRTDIEEELENWPYTKKKDTFIAALETDNNPILEEARYRWDAIIDNNSFKSLISKLNMEELQSQPGTTKYGFEVPAIIEETGLDELYIECFEKSAKLFAALINEQPGMSEYSLLQGHKNRWQFTTTALSLKKAQALSTASKDRLIDLMIEKITERHALIGDFISKPTDKEEKHTSTMAVQKTKKTARVSLPRRRRSKRSKG